MKYKVNKSQEFVIGGYTPDNPLDALIVGYYDGDELIYAAKVRNGFVPRLRREVWQKLKGLETASCPFANLPEKKRTQFSLTREEMKTAFGLSRRWLVSLSLPNGRVTAIFGIQSFAAYVRTKSRAKFFARGGLLNCQQ